MCNNRNKKKSFQNTLYIHACNWKKIRFYRTLSKTPRVAYEIQGRLTLTPTFHVCIRYGWRALSPPGPFRRPHRFLKSSGVGTLKSHSVIDGPGSANNAHQRRPGFLQHPNEKPYPFD